MNKKLNHFLIFFLFCFLLVGCVQTTIKRKIEGLAPNEISTIKTENKSVSIVGIDGDKTSGSEALVGPGEHEFDIAHGNSRYIYKLKTEPGSTYIIKHQLINYCSLLWFEEVITGKEIGKVLASICEPIRDFDDPLDNSVYFKMKPPQELGWVIASRSPTQTVFAKEGNNLDESYAIKVDVFELPNVNSFDEFKSYIMDGQEKDTDLNRFKIVKNEMSKFEEREDYCISYHFVAEDKKAVKRSKNKDMMLLEMIGYTCRHPENKNTGVNFDYSNRYYSGNRDEALNNKAHESFELLQF